MVIFLRTRHALTLAVSLLVLVAVGIVVSTVMIRPTSQSELRIPVGLVLPLIPAAIIGATSAAPALQLRERRAERRVWMWQAAWLFAATLVTAAVLALGTQQLLIVGYTAASVARNTAGLVGLALIGSALLGPTLSWIPPLVWLVVPGYIFPNIYADHAGILTFFVQSDGRFSSLLTALVLFVVGMVLRSFTGRRLPLVLNRGKSTRRATV